MEPGDTHVMIGEMKVPLPKMPPEKFMRNYGKPPLKQKFERRIVPDRRNWSRRDRELYAEQQWHRRWHGEWWLIKGKPYYFPGNALLFFDDWTLETGNKPDFRMEGLHFFQVWELYVVPDPNVYGLFDVKVRRLGDTEKANCINYDIATKYKNVINGMNSYTDEEVIHNLQRLFYAHERMPDFFRPIWRGSDKVSDKLHFTKPPEKQTVRKLKNDDYDKGEYLESLIDTKPTKDGAFDGWRLKFYHLDEVFKIKRSQMNVEKQVRNIKECLALNGGMVINGKMLLTSTIEQTDDKIDAATLDMAESLWEKSDPNHRPVNGRTTTGLVRWMRDYTYNAPVDEWGFHQVEEYKAKRDQEEAYYLQNNMTEELSNLYRKHPANIQQALNNMSSDCVLHPQMCRKRINQIKNNQNWLGEEYDRDGKKITQKIVVGNLEWKDNRFGGSVVFVPNPAGHWHVSQFPLEPNKVTRIKNMLAPNNTINYRMGADPYDADQTAQTGSDGAFAVKRRYNPLHENRIDYDINGEPLNVWDMETDQYVCDYKFRPKNPYHFYEAVLKTCIWYGTAVFPELDKAGFATWMRAKGYSLFLQFESSLLIADLGSRKKARQGAKATEAIVDRYIEQLSSYVYRRVACCHHPRILEQWEKFTRKKRGKLDLAVSTGFAELADLDQVARETEERHDDEENGWNNFFEDAA